MPLSAVPGGSIWPGWAPARGLLAPLTRLRPLPPAAAEWHYWRVRAHRGQHPARGLARGLPGSSGAAGAGSEADGAAQTRAAGKGPHPPRGLQALLQRGLPRPSGSSKAGRAGCQESHRALPVSATRSPELQDGAWYLLAGGPGGRVDTQAGRTGRWGGLRWGGLRWGWRVVRAGRGRAWGSGPRGGARDANTRRPRGRLPEAGEGA